MFAQFVSKLPLSTHPQGISPDVLRKVNRAESYLWDDPAMSGRIRFRFDGTSFPPRIMWKMYCARTKVDKTHVYHATLFVDY